MALFERVKEIISGYEVEISSAMEMLGFCKGKKISFVSPLDRDGYNDIIPKLNAAFGEPVFVDPYYGLIWKVDGEIFTFGYINEGYDYGAESIYVFNKMPWGKKLEYSKYKQIDTLVNQIISEHNLIPSYGISYYLKAFNFFGESEDTHCIISIKKNSLKCYFLKKEPLESGMTRLNPLRNVKKAVDLNNLVLLKETLEECFVTDKM